MQNRARGMIVVRNAAHPRGAALARYIGPRRLSTQTRARIARIMMSRPTHERKKEREKEKAGTRCALELSAGVARGRPHVLPRADFPAPLQRSPVYFPSARALVYNLCTWKFEFRALSFVYRVHMSVQTHIYSVYRRVTEQARGLY